MNRFKKLNTKGFGHHLLVPILVIGIVAAIGAYVLVKSRAESSGALDASFGTAGIVKTSFGENQSVLASISIDPTSNKIVAGGTSAKVGKQSNTSSSVIARYNTNGSLDTSFGSGGRLITNFGGKEGRVKDLAVDSKGRTIVAAVSIQGPKSSLVFARLNVNGSLDSSYGSRGTFSSDSKNDALSLALDGSDRMVTFSGTQIVRYTANGSADSSFTATTLPAKFTPYRISLDSHGKIIVGGYFDRTTSTGTDWHLGVVRLAQNGGLDTAFGTQGAIDIDLPQGRGEIVSGLVIDASDHILISGGGYKTAADKYGAVIRFNNDGTNDSSFSGDGIVETDQQFGRVAVTLTGKVALVGGTGCNYSSGQYAALNAGCAYGTRVYNSDGSQDTAFGTDGLVKALVEPGFDKLADAASDTKGNLVIGGTSGGGLVGDSTEYFNLIRIAF